MHRIITYIEKFRNTCFKNGRTFLYHSRIISGLGICFLFSSFINYNSSHNAIKKKLTEINENPVCIYTDKDSLIFEQIAERARLADWDTLAKEQLILNVATFFLGTEYVGGTLEHEGEETLVLNLRGLDCTTYLENVIAIAQIISEEEFSFPEYLNQLKKIRYRGDSIAQYPSRLHYFSDWLYDNQKEGLVEIIEIPELSEPYEKKVNFMSTHTESYKKLNNSDFVNEIKEQEKRINERSLKYIPQEKISLAGDKIKTGDLIAITTSIEGLDIMHTGFAIDINGSIHLIHASSLQKEVIISPLSLHDMIKDNKLMSGIIVARMK